tara:strand:+ start:286 stop:582 length:297 start_codon:yes stop_codon:yes gene_type:complete
VNYKLLIKRGKSIGSWICKFTSRPQILQLAITLLGRDLLKRSVNLLSKAKINTKAAIIQIPKAISLNFKRKNQRKSHKLFHRSLLSTTNRTRGRFRKF